MNDDAARLVSDLETSLRESTFVKLVLSKYKGAIEHLQRLTLRPVAVGKGLRIAFQFRYSGRDEVKMFDAGETAAELAEWLSDGFRNAHLFTTAGDVQLTIGKRSSRLTRGRASFDSPAALTHDRIKDRIVDPSAYYLKALGVTNDAGSVRAGQQDKWRQINKFVEIVDGLFERSGLAGRSEIAISDLASGKGYLTFAIYDHFTGARGLKVRMEAVEQRAELARLCNDISRASGFEGLAFRGGRIADPTEGADCDILIALHACDNATDDALYQGIQRKASIIVAAPCCHAELRPQITAPPVMADILSHPTMLARFASDLTDGIRSMLLAASGYSTKLFEFVPVEHTPKNLLLVGVRDRRNEARRREMIAKVAELKRLYGIREQRLDRLLALTSAD
jgi:hypothetical protein